VKFAGNKELIQLIGADIDKPYLEQIHTLSIDPEVIKRQHDLKIVYTPLHGTGMMSIPQSLKLWGFDNVHCVKEQMVRSGDFPTVKSPNPENGEALALELFTNVTNSFVDEFSELLCGHVRADFFKSLGALMRSFFALERSLLAIAAPQKKDRSVVKEAIKKGGYQNKFTNPEDIFNLD